MAVSRFLGSAGSAPPSHRVTKVVDEYDARIHIKTCISICLYLHERSSHAYTYAYYMSSLYYFHFLLETGRQTDRQTYLYM